MVTIAVLNSPAHIDELHAVEEGSRNGIRGVSSTDKEDLAKVHWSVQVMVEEVGVLLGIK